MKKNETTSLKALILRFKGAFFILLFILFVFTGSVLSQVAQQWVARYNGPGNGYDYANSIAVDGSGNVYVTGYSSGSGTSFDYCTIKYNSSGDTVWVRRYNGPENNSYDEAHSIAVDGSGNVYVTGRSTGSGTNDDYCTIKYNSSGVQQWVARYNGPENGYDQAHSIAVDGSGNVYVTGWSYGSGGINYDYCTIKYNSSGIQQWVARYNGPGNGYDYAHSIAVDGSGNVYVTGYSDGGGTSYDYCTIKYNSSGVQQWVARYNGPGNGSDYAYSLVLDGSGNVYVTGYSTGNGANADYCTIKYNSAGVQQWVARYNGPGNDDDEAKSIALDGSGNVYVTGGSKANGTLYDYCTIKYNSSGVQQWVARYNGPGNGYDYANSIAVDGSGNVYVTGWSDGSGIYKDYCTIKYNSAGDTVWVARYNGPGNGYDEAYSIAVDGSGNVYVTGYSSNGTNYDYCTIKYLQSPMAPILYSPGNNTQGWNTSLTLIWYKVSNATNYRVQVATDSLFNTLIVNDSTLTDSTKAVSGLQNNTWYYWRVAGRNSYGQGPWSAVWKFKTYGPVTTAPVLYSPGNNTQGWNTSLTLVWYKVSNAANYRVQVATDSLFNTLIVNDSTLTDSTKAVSGLQNNTWYYWRVAGRNSYGQGPWSAVWKFKTGPVNGLQAIGNEIPKEFKLIQNYPNPFNPNTRIRFDLPKNVNVKLTIYDMLGREIETIVNEHLNAGRYEVVFDASKYTSGVYYYRLNAGEFVETKKMILVK